jgi:PPOX class probable F420-dependent enzyme
VDVDGAREFLRTNHHAVLATTRSDGRPQLSPVAVAVDADGRVIISTRETAVKVRNVRRDPHVSLSVFTDRFYGEWVQVEGAAEVVPLPEAMDGLIDYYRRASGGEHPDWDDYRAAMVRERRCLIRFAIERAGPVGVPPSGKA